MFGQDSGTSGDMFPCHLSASATWAGVMADGVPAVNSQGLMPPAESYGFAAKLDAAEGWCYPWVRWWADV
jgi:hypothetical protein